jgi:transposase
VKQSRLKFIDEGGVNRAMTRSYGRAPRGVRVHESVPRNYGRSTTIVSLLGVSGIGATMLLEGALDTLAFNCYCEQVLRDSIKDGDIIVLDNLTSHRASRIEEIVKECGGQVLWLSPYSPDFSPIEKMWSKLKTFLRRVKARTQKELDEAIAEGLNLVTSSDCRGWFRSCGYEVSQS